MALRLSSLWMILPIVLCLCLNVYGQDETLEKAPEGEVTEEGQAKANGNGKVNGDGKVEPETRPLTAAEAYFKEFPVQSAQVVAPPIPNVANEDGSGLFWELVRGAFEPLGMRVHINDMRLHTGIKMLTRYRSIDVVFGVQDKADETLLSFYPLMEISISAMHPRGQSLKSVLRNSRTRILLYGNLILPKVLEKHSRIKVCRSLKNCYRTLKRRIAVAMFINPADVDARQLKLSGYQLTAFPKPMLIYAMFRDDVQGKVLKKLLDLRLMELNEKGELAKIYDKWNQGLPTLFLKRQPPDWL